MGARQIINSAYLNGAAIAGICLGVVCGNVMIGFLVFAIVMGFAFVNQDLRFTGQKRR